MSTEILANSFFAYLDKGGKKDWPPAPPARRPNTSVCAEYSALKVTQG